MKAILTVNGRIVPWITTAEDIFLARTGDLIGPWRQDYIVQVTDRHYIDQFEDKDGVPVYYLILKCISHNDSAKRFWGEPPKPRKISF